MLVTQHDKPLAHAVFQLLGDVKAIEPIAVNLSIRERKDLKARYGGRR